MHYPKKHLLKIFAALMSILIAGVVFCCSKKNRDAPYQMEDLSVSEAHTQDLEALDAREEQTEPETIWVYVCGEVNRPGVYRLPSGARVFEAIEMAGGFTEEALEESLNLASVLSDGQKVSVPDSAEETKDHGAAEPGDTPGDGRVDLNRATASELMTLPGIGSAKAQAIVEYREQHRFQTIDEIMNVSGIKENTFQKIRDLITVS